MNSPVALSYRTGPVGRSSTYVPPPKMREETVGSLLPGISTLESIRQVNITPWRGSFPAKLTPVISWANPAGITYGTALSGTQLNATADVPGTFVYSPASGAILNAGSRCVKREMASKMASTGFMSCGMGNPNPTAIVEILLHSSAVD
jgi:hypothetical protein